MKAKAVLLALVLGTWLGCSEGNKRSGAGKADVAVRTAASDAVTGEKTKSAVERLHEHIDTLSILVSLKPVGSKRKDPSPGLRSVDLHVRLVPREPHGVWPNGKPISADSLISVQRARKLVRVLAKSGFFEEAGRYHYDYVVNAAEKIPPPTGSRPYVVAQREDRHCTINVAVQDERYVHIYEAAFPWGQAVTRRVQAMRDAANGEAAQLLDELLAQIALHSEGGVEIEVVAKGGGPHEQEQGLDEALFDAAQRQDIGRVRSLLDKGANVNGRNALGETPLFGAVMANSREIVQYLIERGADVNARDANGITPLHAAEELVGENNVETMKALLRKNGAVEFEVAAAAHAAPAKAIPASNVRFLTVPPDGEKRSGLYCVGWLKAGAKYSYPHLFRDAADGKPPRYPARERRPVTLVGKLPGNVTTLDFFEAQEGSIRGREIDVPARFVSYRGPTDKVVRRHVYVVAHLPALKAGRYRAQIAFEEFEYHDLLDRTKIRRAPPKRPFRFAPLTCEFEVSVREEGVSLERAVAIARKECKGVKIPDDAIVETKREGRNVVITFRIPIKTPRPGASYYARIVVNAKTGAVVQRFAADE